MRNTAYRRRKRDCSSLSIWEYLLLNVCFGYAASFLVYEANIGFVGYISFYQSKAYTVLYMAVSCSLCCFFTYQRDRTKLGVLFNILIGASAYTLSLYWKSKHGLCALFVMITLIVIALVTILVFFQNRSKNHPFLPYLKKRLVFSFFRGRTIAAMIGAIAILLLPISYYLNPSGVYTIEPIERQTKGATPARSSENGRVYQESDYIVNAVYGDEYRLTNHLDKIKCVASEELWDSLTLQQRQEAIVAVIECEARYLGIPYKLKILFSDEMSYEKKGSYSADCKSIWINNAALMQDGGCNCLVTALHEVRHVYQHCMCDVYAKLTPEERNLYCFYGIDEWCKNINEYIYGEESYEEYRNQVLEEDARSYSLSEAYTYIAEIRKLLGEEGDL